jgi:hypothetical protein
MSATVVPDNFEGFADMAITVLWPQTQLEFAETRARAGLGRLIFHIERSLLERVLAFRQPTTLAHHDSTTAQQRIGGCRGAARSGGQSGHRCCYLPSPTVSPAKGATPRLSDPLPLPRLPLNRLLSTRVV